MKSFFSLLRYSFGNEDWKTERDALNIQPEDQVLCITASGDRPLNLLTKKCKKIVCLDANPAQNYLLELKSAALKVLDFDQYISFLGGQPCKKRRETWSLIAPQMTPEAVKFWNKNLKMIDKGIIYQGTVEKITSFIAKAASLVRGKKIKRLFAINNLEEQRKFLSEEWNSIFWRKLFKFILNPWISRFWITDPGVANVSNGINAGTYIYDRMNKSLERNLAKNNPLLSLIFKGTVCREAFSPYLTESGTEAIRTNLTSLEIKTQNLLDYLDSLEGPTFDVFSLSDVASYLSYTDYVRLLKNIIRTAKPGARFCLRQFLSTYEIPHQYQPFFKRDRILEKQLEERDNCFVYRFTVGTINKVPLKEKPFTAKKKTHKLALAGARG